MKSQITFIMSLLLMIVGFASCRKIIAVDVPVNQLTKDKIYTDSASTIAVLDNTYALFNQSIESQYTPTIAIYTDELGYTGTNNLLTQFYQSAVSPNNGYVLNIWSRYYSAIYGCNDIIEGLNNYDGILPSTKNEIISEVKFLRAFSYFYLVNTFGPVPLITQTDVNKTATAPRADSIAVYKQIVEDLTDAQSGLSENYIGPGKVRANKWAATALLARVYLYQKRYAEAELAATAVIGSGLYTPLQAPASVFLAGSKESILQFYTQFGYSADGSTFVPSSGKPNYIISTTQLNSFEAGDFRKTAWINTSNVTSGGKTTVYYYPYKYRNRTTNTSSAEYLVVLRVSEQYLIRAEARLQQNNISGAIADLNIIRKRAGIPPLATNISFATCMDAIIHERQTELFAEMGHRFFDLKRTGRLNGVMSAYKTTWKTNAYILPIPITETANDPNLTQNAGY